MPNPLRASTPTSSSAQRTVNGFSHQMSLNVSTLTLEASYAITNANSCVREASKTTFICLSARLVIFPSLKWSES
jgi:hypothetical protein